MLVRIATALAALSAAFPLAAQTAAPPAAPATVAPAPQADLVRVALETEQGRIVLALDRGRAPATVANFLRYVDAHRFDGISFYRAMPYGEPGNGMIQSGITDPAKLYPPIAFESTAQTGLHHDAGAISMAMTTPGSARATFFILAGPIPGFDAKPGDPGFAAFGHVVEGLDVVKAILAGPIDPTKGDAYFKGQMLAHPVKVLKATRLP